MDRPTDQILDAIADHLNRDGIVACADLIGADEGNELSMPDLSAALRDHGYRGADLHDHTIETEFDTTTIAYDRGRFRTDRSAEEAWTSLRRQAQRERFERRADDWLRRLDELKTQIGQWVTDVPQIEFVDRPLVAMNEDLMHEYGIGPRSMPSFDLLVGRRRAVRFQPKGLWILGGNGRVDLITPATALILIDRSEPFSTSSRWTVYRPQDRTQGILLNGEVFRHVVETGDLA